jgi:TolB protein
MTGILHKVNWRVLLPGQRSELRVADMATGATRLVHESRRTVYEAPNWSPDGEWLVVNAAGSLLRVPADGSGEPERIDTGSVVDNNNDHLLSRDGTIIYTSAEVDGHLYAAPMAGGEPRRVSNEREEPFGYFLQGVSPDGSTLAYAGAERRAGRDFLTNLFTIPADGGADVRLTDWDQDAVGCDYSPDGSWLYFNSEHHAQGPGHMQIYRMRPDGSGIERLTHDERSNWFPKPSPDGNMIIYLAFPLGTLGHGANLPVTIRAMDPDGSRHRDVVDLFGGQGTLNVNSWAPDGRYFAYMSYPID